MFIGIHSYKILLTSIALNQFQYKQNIKYISNHISGKWHQNTSARTDNISRHRDNKLYAQSSKYTCCVLHSGGCITNHTRGDKYFIHIKL